eukprot:9172890-Lingulodinium_polyedra.AAC.1
MSSCAAGSCSRWQLPPLLLMVMISSGSNCIATSMPSEKVAMHTSSPCRGPGSMATCVVYSLFVSAPLTS